MTDIIKLAREAGAVHIHERPKELALVGNEAIERFFQAAYAAGAAAEREACAKVCDGKVEAEYATGKVDHNEMAWAQSCAIDIRARSINQ